MCSARPGLEPMAGQDTQLTLGGAGDEHLRLAAPHTLLDRDDFDLQPAGHYFVNSR